MPLPSNDKQVGDIGHADDHNAIVNEINALIAASAALSTQIISSITDSAPATLDTLNELAAALGDDPNFATSTASAIGERLTIASASAIYLPISSSVNYLPMGASSNFATVTISTNAQTGTSYTLAASDSAKIIEMNNAAANLVIIPLNSSVPFPIGTQIEVVQTGAGATSASIVSGVTLNSEAGKRTINAQWQGASLIKRGTDSWIMMGAIKA